ncbi:MAG: glutamate--tRNA ligase [Desulfobacterales bacterium]|nr:glutamate--tRNA ligase [Desulfobacterales bacterium]MDD4070898.1 glutamate--tRNA ligase [Desulfobacterales bacterium]MDD4392905.1 glutamate--tRNA ligase [Desulfobacterales bacterium]
MNPIITRFPPSPSGYLHVGGARTALFNWLYARHMKGKFVLRIEDTDSQRSTQESVDAIFNALEWLGIDWDEGPYFQTQRFPVYREYIQKLLDSGHAYYCTCSKEAIEEMRQKAIAQGNNPKYDGTCRNKSLPQSDNAVVRFRTPQSGTTVIHDIVKGNIVIQNSELDDFIIQRSDGTPTYNLAVVVDDITMQINTIIRGDDHVSNTPKQILLFKALGSALPTFGHVPMVLGGDRTRLSKRHGATSVMAYKDMGLLPEAFLNYLVRLGWSHGDQEFFTIPELIEKFSIEHIGRSPGVFDLDKLLALNAEHIRASKPSRLAPLLVDALKDKGIQTEEGPVLEKIIRTLQARSKTLIEMAEGALFYFQDDIIYDETAARKFLKKSSLASLELLRIKLLHLDDFTEKNLEDCFQQVMDDTGLKLGKIAQPVRVALTGKTASPGIFEIVEILGLRKVIDRIDKALEYISKLA